IILDPAQEFKVITPKSECITTDRAEASAGRLSFRGGGTFQTLSVHSLDALPIGASSSLLLFQTISTDQETRSDTGVILFTEYGLSGPAVMQVSRVAGNWERAKKGACTVSLDVFPDMREQDLVTLLSRRRALKGRTLENFFTGFLNKRIGQTVIRAAGLPLTAPVDRLTDDDIVKLVKLLKNWTFTVLGTKGFTGAQVTAGGITANEFRDSTMESCYQQGIFAAGEVLDVDGDCGGFNLQFVFASAAVAAGGILRRVKGSAVK
ncbi:MAG: NAD(P)/FAD-dependent oxidoreductase, partial [Clostridia bacterium]|nr:NAD(P)/FAD-dependent oxidoreductase [Clostridia bacterium]